MGGSPKPDPSRAAAQAFVFRHLAIVEPIARKMREKLPPTFELEDLIQAGRLGLVMAAYTYRPEAGPEDHWAWFCVRKEIRNIVCGAAYVSATREVELSPQMPAAPVDAREESPSNEKLAIARRRLSNLQGQLIRLVYEGGVSLRQVGRQKLLGVGWRRTLAEHEAALAELRSQLAC